MAKVILAGMMVIVTSGSAYAQQCLHQTSETSANRARREQAVQLAHRINAEQAKAIAGSLASRYKRASELNLSGVPDNFQFTLQVNGRTSYAFSLKDHADPCYFAVFSDQDGFVYATHPERPQLAARGSR